MKADRMDLKQRARRFVRRLRDEYDCLRQLGARRVLSEPFARRSPWWSTLPLQRPLCIALPLSVEALSAEGWPAALDAAGIPFIESMHTVYLEPATLALAPFAALRERYPADAALKISKHEGGIDGAPYARRGAESALYRTFSYNHRRLTLVANALHQHGIAPRLYDLLELETGGLRHAAYAVQHVSGRPPDDAEWAAGLARLRELEAGRAFQISALRGYAHRDFARPHCNGNAWVQHGSGRFLYVDFQNFLLCDHAGRLAELANGAALPGFEGDAGADVRLDDLDALLCAHGGTLQDALVVDASCGTGARMAHALRKGARWVHGIGPGRELPRVEERLFALGCTRFSLAAEEALRSGAAWELPEFLRAGTARAVAIVEAPSVALRDLVARSPWSFAWTLDSEPARADELARAAGARVLARAEQATRRAVLLGRSAP
jgi:hypothetical protein